MKKYYSKLIIIFVILTSSVVNSQVPITITATQGFPPNSSSYSIKHESNFSSMVLDEWGEPVEIPWAFSISSASCEGDYENDSFRVWKDGEFQHLYSPCGNVFLSPKIYNPGFYYFVPGTLEAGVLTPEILSIVRLDIDLYDESLAAIPLPPSALSDEDVVGEWFFGRSKENGQAARQEICSVILSTQWEIGQGYIIEGPDCGPERGTHWNFESGNINFYRNSILTTSFIFSEGSSWSWEGLYVEHPTSNIAHFLSSKSSPIVIEESVPTHESKTCDAQAWGGFWNSSSGDIELVASGNKLSGYYGDLSNPTQTLDGEVISYQGECILLGMWGRTNSSSSGGIVFVLQSPSSFDGGWSYSNIALDDYNNYSGWIGSR